MYKVMIADDEGIVIESLKFIIEKNFRDQCIIESAKTGRSVIELAENFRPDIAFMDIQMPGINGIDAMKEIRKQNKNIIFIIVSAYNKFDYAKEAINIDVLDYVNKPIEQKKIVEILSKAMQKVDEEKNKRSNDLKTREKLEIVVPFIETGFIYSVLFQENFEEEISNYRQLLGIEEDGGFMMVIECGEERENGHFTNAIGTSVKAQSYYQDLRSIIKEHFNKAVVGSLMSNKVIIFVPCEVPGEEEYEGRIRLIDDTRKMVRQLQKSIDVKFRAGIGKYYILKNINTSYKEAGRALQYSQGSVGHAMDLPVVLNYDNDYPIEIENSLFTTIEEGNVSKADIEARKFYDWMVDNYPQLNEDIKLKVLEMVLWAEKLAYLSGGMTYHFASRHDYLNTINSMKDYDEIKLWFLDRINEATRNISDKKQESSVSVVEKAKEYINENFDKEISLDEVSKKVNISPYYFSKLFKDETGTNFIEYLTDIRINEAKKLLLDRNMSMKEICMAVGYSDPNYFSRTFKKNVGVTPTEYRESR